VGPARKILVVDPEPERRQALRGHLGHRGAFVEVAASAPDAIRQGLALTPDVLVVNWRLAEGTGAVDVLEALARECPGLTTIVTVAPEDLDEASAECADLGLDDPLTHPLSRVALDERLDALRQTPDG